MSDDMKKITDLLASRFIERRDVKSEQKRDAYHPVTSNGRNDGDRLPWTRDDLIAHVEGRRSFGHYLVGQNGNAKLFAFDIDLTKWSEKSGRPCPTWVPIDEDGMTVDVDPKKLQPREAWLHPKAPPELRRFLTAQMMGIADLLARVTIEVVGVPVAVSYSGGKGMHVYGFTGSAPAHDVRGAAMEVVRYTGQFEPLRGKNFFKHKDENPLTGFGCIDLEVFPKQDDLSGKDLGNLMRLPLGTHARTGQHSHFVSMNGFPDEMIELDPVAALEGGDPWQ